MKLFESDLESIHGASVDVYQRFSSFEALRAMMPDQIVNWEVHGDECSFDIQGMASVVLRYSEKIPERKVTIVSVKAPFKMELVMEIFSEEGSLNRACKTTLLADLNPMLGMLASRPLQHLVETINKKLVG